MKAQKKRDEMKTCYEKWVEVLVLKNAPLGGIMNKGSQEQKVKIFPSNFEEEPIITGKPPEQN